jgi:hypothetical protein
MLMIFVAALSGAGAEPATATTESPRPTGCVEVGGGGESAGPMCEIMLGGGIKWQVYLVYYASGTPGDAAAATAREMAAGLAAVSGPVEPDPQLWRATVLARFTAAAAHTYPVYPKLTGASVKPGCQPLVAALAPVGPQLEQAMALLVEAHGSPERSVQLTELAFARLLLVHAALAQADTVKQC